MQTAINNAEIKSCVETTPIGSLLVNETSHSFVVVTVHDRILKRLCEGKNSFGFLPRNFRETQHQFQEEQDIVISLIVSAPFSTFVLSS